MDKVALSEELQGTGQLLHEVANYNLVEASVRDTWVFPCHVARGRMCDEFLPLLNKERKITKFAIFHDEIDMCGRFEAVMEGDDVRMSEVLEDVDFTVQVLLELLIKTGKFDRFDSYCGTGNL